MKAIVIDNGLYPDIAKVLGESSAFSSVSYFAPWQADFATTRERVIGTGFDSFERIWHLTPGELDKYEAFIFPDLYWGALADELFAMGAPVWGAGSTEELELDRTKLLSWMTRNGMKVPKHEIVHGVNAARAKVKDGHFVKISGYSRGDMETMEHSQHLANWANKLNSNLGPLADSMPLVLEAPIEAAVEGGYDRIIVAGQPLRSLLFGYEAKDAGYICASMDDLPAEYAAEDAKILAGLPPSYTQFLSTEFRGGHLIDITCRTPAPPDAQIRFWKNFPQIVAKGVCGEPVDQEPLDGYLMQIVIKNKKADEFGWLDVPERLERHVIVKRSFRHDDLLWTAPQREEDLNEVGSVWAAGSSCADAAENLKEIVSAIKTSPNISIDESVADRLEALAAKEAVI